MRLSHYMNREELRRAAHRLQAAGYDVRYQSLRDKTTTGFAAGAYVANVLAKFIPAAERRAVSELLGVKEA